MCLDRDGGNPVESAGMELLQEYSGDGIKTCGNTVGMEFIAAGNLRMCFVKRAIIWLHTDFSVISTPRLMEIGGGQIGGC